MTPIRATPSAAAGSKDAKGEARPSVFQGRFLMLRLGRIDQRHILKVAIGSLLTPAAVWSSSNEGIAAVPANGTGE